MATRKNQEPGVTTKAIAATKQAQAKARKGNASKARAAQPVSTHPAPQVCTPEERYCLIAEAAYRLAEMRGFDGDKMLDDWLRAETEVDTQLSLKEQP